MSFECSPCHLIATGNDGYRIHAAPASRGKCETCTRVQDCFDCRCDGLWGKAREERLAAAERERSALAGESADTVLVKDSRFASEDMAGEATQADPADSKHPPSFPGFSLRHPISSLKSDRPFAVAPQNIGHVGQVLTNTGWIWPRLPDVKVTRSTVLEESTRILRYPDPWPPEPGDSTDYKDMACNAPHPTSGVRCQLEWPDHDEKMHSTDSPDSDATTLDLDRVIEWPMTHDEWLRAEDYRRRHPQPKMCRLEHGLSNDNIVSFYGAPIAASGEPRLHFVPPPLTRGDGWVEFADDPRVDRVVVADGEATERFVRDPETGQFVRTPPSTPPESQGAPIKVKGAVSSLVGYLALLEAMRSSSDGLAMMLGLKKLQMAREDARLVSDYLNNIPG